MKKICRYVARRLIIIYEYVKLGALASRECSGSFTQMHVQRDAADSFRNVHSVAKTLRLGEMHMHETCTMAGVTLIDELNTATQTHTRDYARAK